VRSKLCTLEAAGVAQSCRFQAVCRLVPVVESA
jgi:hypothetical protein